jgi:Mg2+ and Co2+ transporter CorA
MENIEEKVFGSKDNNIQESIFQDKKRISALKRSISPKRVVLKSLVHSEFPNRMNEVIKLMSVMPTLTLASFKTSQNTLEAAKYVSLCASQLINISGRHL